MREITLSDGTNLLLLAKRDLGLEPEEYREYFREIFSVLDSLAYNLDVQCPDISIAETITQINDKTGQISIMDAMTYHTADFPELENNILQFRDPGDGIHLTGILAHEMRHLYQQKYTPEIFSNGYAQGYNESLFDASEIDADGFAIFHLVKGAGITYEKAAGIVCPYEKKHDPKAFFYRIEKAKEISVEIEEKFALRKKQKKTFFEKVTAFLSGNKNKKGE